jgi:hypothetical protein
MPVPLTKPQATSSVANMLERGVGAQVNRYDYQCGDA